MNTIAQRLCALLLCLGCFLFSCPPGGGPVAPATTVHSQVAPAAQVAQAQQQPEKTLRLGEWTGKFSERWSEVERLQNEQKFEAAAKAVLEILEKARAAGNGEEILRAMIRTVQLRTGLHGYETAVRWFREQPWPEDLLGQVACELYYSQLLVFYAKNYQWEIRQRQKVESKGPVDLKSWTSEQIYSEANAAYRRVFKYRERLGDLAADKLGEYISLGDYPQEIRPTLRDIVVYLWVQLLADNNSWTPEQRNEVFALELGQLLAEAKPLAEESAIEQMRHPLAVAAAALSDLEAWNAKKGRPEAALEARLERLRRLYISFVVSEDRDRIRENLENYLKNFEKHPWWAVGAAELAGWMQQQDAPDALVRARQLARRCEKRFPDSIGGKRCRHIAESIEQPAFSLEGMALDGPGKPSLLVYHKNLPEIHFKAFALDLEKTIQTSDDYNIFPNWQEIEKITNQKPAAVWKKELPTTVDFRMHQTFVVPPLQEPGYYLIVASGRADFGRDNNYLVALNFIVSDLVMISRQEGSWLEVTVLSGQDGRPVQNVEVSLYKYDWQKKHHPVSTARTGADGRAGFSGNQNQPYFLFARKDRQVSLDPNYLYMYASSTPTKEQGTLLYTDRSVYRPLQKLHFKAVVYGGSRKSADFRTLPHTAVTVSLLDANRQKVASLKLRTNAEGTASGSFDIPAGRLLGQWSLEAAPQGWASIRVEEYKRPTFEVKLLEAKEALRLNQPAKLKGEARYYFGLPVSSGKVVYRVERTPVYPWWWGWWYGAQDTRAQTVGSGTTKLASDGTFEISFVPKADERLAEKQPELSYRYRVSAEVTDEGGETRTAEKSFRLGFVAVEARLVLENEFLLAKKEGEIAANRTNLDGAPAPGKGSYRLLRLHQPQKTLLPAEQPLPDPPGLKNDQAFVTAGDRQRRRWRHDYSYQAVMRAWPDGAEIAKGELSHGENGEAKLKLPALEAGAYRVRYQTRDAFGKEFKTAFEFVVAAEKTPLNLPALLLVENDSVSVGETARLFVHSGMEKQPLILDLYRDGKLEKRRQLEAGRDSSIIEIPVDEKRRGGFGVTLWALRDHQFVSFSRAIKVPWDNKALRLEFASFRDLLRPGQKETWTIKVTGPAGKDTAVAGAEVLAYMYDRSLDVFAAHTPPAPITLFPDLTATAVVRTGVGQGQLSWLHCSGFDQPYPYPYLEPASLQFPSGYGIGGPGYRGAYLRRGEYAVAAQAAPRMGPAKKAEAAPPAPPAAKVADRAAEKAVDFERPQITAATGKPGQPSAQAQAQAPVELRTDFSETAFFKPHLLTSADGTVRIEFQVPDSVTSWNVWAHAIRRNLASGSIKKESRTVKDLMVRPYLPRFLREGDEAILKVVVNNASQEELSGRLDFDILEPESERSLLAEFGLEKAAAGRDFRAPAGGSANVEFKIKTPVRVGLVAVKVVARAGEFSDGELRPLPLLPGRMHLMQSRFVTLRGKQKRQMRFDDLARGGDPTLINEQLVVTLDAQLFYSVLAAVPYLVEYPYECTEQLMNRFLSTGILTSMYDQFPAVARMAKKLSARETRLERFDKPDPNRKMALEETPWLQQAQGGAKTEHPLINVLVPAIAKAHREAALEKLRKAQTSSGAFPWFPGGPPSPYITLYLLYGFSKGLEFGVEVPKDMIQRAWRYMQRHFVDELVSQCMALDLCWELITFLNYTLSNYPDESWSGGVFSKEQRADMLNFSFRHWKQHSPLLKGYLALTLKRMDREKDALLVWESVMDSAKTEQDQGTFWAPEERAWLWYNDSIETHAFAVRTELELNPKDEKLDGLVLWLLLNKKLNHWKSTKATAEVIYSLAHYMKKEKQLGVREEATVRVGNEEKRFVFEPDEYTGKGNQLVVPGPQIDAQKHALVEVEKATAGFMFASASWHFSTEKLPAEARGDFLSVERQFFKREKTGRETVLKPLAEGAPIEVGDEIEVHIQLRSKHPVGYVHLRDPRPAGCEPVSLVSSHKWNLGIYWYEEVRDSGMNFFFEQLPQGEYPFVHRMRAAVAGTFKVAPATVQPMYAPEFAAYSAGSTLQIKPARN